MEVYLTMSMNSTVMFQISQMTNNINSSMMAAQMLNNASIQAEQMQLMMGGGFGNYGIGMMGDNMQMQQMQMMQQMMMMMMQ